MARALPSTYAEAIDLCGSLASRAFLEPRDAEDDAVRRDIDLEGSALATMGRFLEDGATLLASLPVPTRRDGTSREAPTTDPDADVTQVLPAMLVCLELARSAVTPADEATDSFLRHERRRELAAVALLTDLVTVHGDVMAKVVLPEAPSPSV